jgi:aminoglycoside N3'-acetyltransferase
VSVTTIISNLRALVEVLLRQIYWRFSPLQILYKSVRSKAPSSELNYLDLDQLAEVLREAGIQEGSCLMVHSSVDGIGLRTGGRVIEHQLQVASELLKFLKTILGPTGTLVMPTHPHYRDDPGFMFTKTELRLTYDPLRTPSKVGLLTEMFRRSSGSIRSLHPLSSITAAGPLAQEIVGSFPKPGDLPHGKNSPYKRFCDAGGVIVGINVSFINALTIVHVAEELRDADWTVDGFFYDRIFNIVEEGTNVEIIVRERHPKWVRSISLNALRSDLLNEGLIVERYLCGVQVGSANGTKVVDYMLTRNASSTYPYFFLRKSKHVR